MSPRFFIPALLLLAAARAHSQESAPPSPPPVALDELIARALTNNPQPQIAAANLAAARARAQAARATLGPVLQIAPGIGGNAESRDEEIILSQPIDLFGGRRANRAVFEAQLRGAQAQSDAATRALIIAVKKAAAELFAAQEAESLGEIQLDIAGRFRAAAARRAQLGEVPAVQAQRAQLELDRAAIELDAARAGRSIRRVRLNQLIGAPPATPLSVKLPGLSPTSPQNISTSPQNISTSPPNISTSPQIIPTSPQNISTSPQNISTSPQNISTSPQIISTSPQNISTSPSNISTSPPNISTSPASSQVGADLVAQRAALLSGALRRPDIIAVQSEVDVARAQAAAIAATRRPQLEIQARRGGVFDSAATSLRAVFTVPLFGLGESRSRQRAAELEAQAAEKQGELLRLQVAADLESALILLEQNRALVARYRDSLVPLALDLLRKTQLGYDEGASTFLEVLEARRATSQIQTEYLQALAGVRSGEADLESALGADFRVPVAAIANPDSLNAPPDVAALGTVPNVVEKGN